MKHKKHSKTTLTCYINRTAFGRIGKEVQSTFDKFIENNGVEYTAIRYKHIWMSSLLHRAGRHDEAKRLLLSNNIKVTHDGYPRGSIGLVSKIYANTRKPKTIRNCTAVLRSYTALVMEKVSKKQYIKVLDSISQPLTKTIVDEVNEYFGPEFYIEYLKDTVILGLVSLIEENAWHLLKEDLKSIHLKIREITQNQEKGIIPWRLSELLTKPTVVKDTDGNSHQFHLSFSKEGKGYCLQDRYLGGPHGGSEKVHYLKPSQKITFFREDFSIDNLRPFTATYAPLGLRKKVKEKPYARALHSALTTWFLPSSLKEINPAESLRSKIEFQQLSNLEGDSLAGRIEILQEGGAKARPIAIPNAWIQLMFYPLHQGLADLNSRLPQIMVNDQNLGALLAKQHRERGGGIYSVDLSSATDRFPLALQVSVLDWLGLDNYRDAYASIPQWEWVMPKGDIISYEVGQPMGLYSSFPLFTLTHAALIQGLSMKVQSKDWKQFMIPNNKNQFSRSPFLVLGDDVIFSDFVLENYYTQWVKLLGMEVSPHKSFAGRVCEFAGFHITDCEHGVSLHRPLKHTGDLRDKIFSLDLLDSLGPKLRRLNPKKWENIIRLYNGTRGLRNPDLSPKVNLKSSFDDLDHRFRPTRDLIRGTLNEIFLTGGATVDITDLHDLDQLYYSGPRKRKSYTSRVQFLTEGQNDLREVENLFRRSHKSWEDDPYLRFLLQEMEKNEHISNSSCVTTPEPSKNRVLK